MAKLTDDELARACRVFLDGGYADWFINRVIYYYKHAELPDDFPLGMLMRMVVILVADDYGLEADENQRILRNLRRL